MTREAQTAGPDAAQQAALRATYVANLDALYRADTDLAATLDAIPFGDCPALETARDGALTVQVTADDGRPIYLHSRYRPTDEATRLVAALPASATPTFFVVGVGLGYHIVALEERYDRPLLLVAESDLPLLKAALCVTDVSLPLRDQRLLFLTEPNKALFHERVGAISADLMLGVHFVVPPAAGRYRAEFNRALQQLMAEFVAYTKMQVVTLLRNARITTQNITFNLAAYLDQPGIGALRNRAQGRPAIVVAAGPSLARNIDQLADLEDKAVLICVQTVLKNLLGRGITPHFVTSLDFHEISKQFFEGLPPVERTTLVAEPKATWHVLDTFQGPRYVLHNTLYDKLLRDAAPRREGLEPGSTVAHLCFYLARWLGCDPIIFVGQDLSFTEAVYYAPGMPVEQVWQPELSRFYTVEMKQWERVVRHRAILKPTTDLHGRPAFTDDQMVSYAEQFEADFARSAQRIIQASEGGRALPGMEVMPLRAAAATYCRTPLPEDLFPPPTSADARPLAEAADRQLAQRLEEVRQMHRIANETANLLERMEQIVNQPREFNRLVNRVDELRIEMQRFDATYDFVTGVSQQAELRRHTADRKLSGIRAETSATARQRLARDREYVESFAAACAFLEEMLPAARQRLQERLL